LTDPKDLYLFSLAQDNDVDFLLTGDKRLLGFLWWVYGSA
jgi:predicted nucleic acid-binding protein